MGNAATTSHLWQVALVYSGTMPEQTLLLGISATACLYIIHATCSPPIFFHRSYSIQVIASAYLRLSGESLENRHTSSAQYKRDSSLLSEQWTQPVPMRPSPTSTQIELKTFAGVASGMVSWRRGGVGDLPPLAIGRSRPAPRFLNMVPCAPSTCVVASSEHYNLPAVPGTRN